MKNHQVLRRRNIGGFVFFFLINCNPSVTTSFFQYKFIFLQQAFLIFYRFHVASYELDEDQRKTSFFVFLRIGTCILLTKTVNIGGFVFFFLNFFKLSKFDENMTFSHLTKTKFGTLAQGIMLLQMRAFFLVRLQFVAAWCSILLHTVAHAWKCRNLTSTGKQRPIRRCKSIFDDQ